MNARMVCRLSMISVFLIYGVYSSPQPYTFDIESLQLPEPLPAYNHDVDFLTTRRPLNIAHRGSSGILPEHTLAAYQRAIDQGADVIECDVILTRDLVPFCAHESWLNETTDVAEKFPDKWTTKVVSGVGTLTDYFSVDLTLDELKSLRVNQLFDFRDSYYNGQYQLATLEEYILTAQAADRPVGIYPETKNPEWVNSLDILKEAGISFEEIVVNLLHKHGYTKSSDPCFLQSFSEQSLIRMSNITDLPLVMLIGGESVTTDGDLDAWAEFCYGIGPSKTRIVDVDRETFRITEVTDLISRAHTRGLKVHAYTFRNEDRYLAWDYLQDPRLEYKHFLSLEIDGFFTDFSGTLSSYLDDVYQYGSSADTPTFTLTTGLFFCLLSTVISI